MRSKLALLTFVGKMPPKRSGDQLTGGTRDVNPQYLTIPFVTPAAPTAGTQTIAALLSTTLPIPRYPEKDGKSIVMEMLNVEFVYDGNPTDFTNSVVGNSFSGYTVALTTNPNQLQTSAALFQDPRTIQYDTWRQEQTVATSVGLAFQTIPTIRDYDLTDRAGHGVLVATDNVYIQQITFNNGAGSSTMVGSQQGVCVVLYRFKAVTLSEYVGIVQSQQ